MNPTQHHEETTASISADRTRPHQKMDLEKTLRRESALPLWSFTDRDFFHWEVERLFYNDWVFACFAEEVAQPGDFYAFTIAGEPVVVMRGQDGTLRALSNVCQHRGAVLVEGTGNTQHISCPYHGWTYRDDGSLLAVPFTGSAELDKSAHCLPAFRVEEWNELIFVSLTQEVDPLSERFAGIERHLGHDFFPGFKRKRVARQASVEHHVNWKLLAENAIDSYHIFKAHLKTLEPSTPTKDAFFVDGNRYWALSGIGQTAAEIHAGGRVGAVGEFAASAMLFLAMPPSFSLLISTDWVAWQHVEPIDVDRTIQHVGVVTNPKARLFSLSMSEVRFYLNSFAVNGEDAAVLDLVQRGSKSRRTQAGPLMSPIEDGIAWLHEYIAAQLLDSKSGGAARADGRQRSGRKPAQPVQR